jgi:hypothetical protein
LRKESDIMDREVVDGANYTANNLNQYTQVGATNYTYDGNGNLSNDGVFAYTYDYENRLITAVGHYAEVYRAGAYAAFSTRAVVVQTVRKVTAALKGGL